VASIRGRIGWATEHVLLYATTGVAFARNDSFKGNVSVGRGGTGSDGEDGDPFRQVALACTTLRLGIRRGERSRMVCAASSMLAFPLRERVTMESVKPFISVIRMETALSCPGIDRRLNGR
jgi:hypothetical protein